jgi:hypothetical protein
MSAQGRTAVPARTPRRMSPSGIKRSASAHRPQRQDRTENANAKHGLSVRGGSFSRMRTKCRFGAGPPRPGRVDALGAGQAMTAVLQKSRSA